jgi:hypothetical protein
MENPRDDTSCNNGDDTPCNMENPKATPSKDGTSLNDMQFKYKMDQIVQKNLLGTMNEEMCAMRDKMCAMTKQLGQLKEMLKSMEYQYPNPWPPTRSQPPASQLLLQLHRALKSILCLPR